MSLTNLFDAKFFATGQLALSKNGSPTPIHIGDINTSGIVVVDPVSIGPNPSIKLGQIHGLKQTYVFPVVVKTKDGSDAEMLKGIDKAIGALNNQAQSPKTPSEGKPYLLNQVKILQGLKSHYHHLLIWEKPELT